MTNSRISNFRITVFTLVLLLAGNLPGLADTGKIDECLSAWGDSPFAKGSKPHKVIGTNVKVFGIGKDNVGDFEKTDKPVLVLVKPSVNVLGKSTIKLMNPNGWYCFQSNVSVLGKIAVEADCNAKLATTNDGATVLGASDADKGVTVLGSFRIKKVNCK